MASIPIKKKYTAELQLEFSVYHHDYTVADKHISLFEPIWFIGLNGNRVNITQAGSFTYTFDEITYNLTVTPLNAERVINIPLTYTKGEFNFDVGSKTHKYIFNYKPGVLVYEYWIDDWTVDPNKTSSWDGYGGWIIQLNQTPNWSTNTVNTINQPFVVEVEETGSKTIKDVKYGLVPEDAPTYTFDRRVSYTPTIKNPETIYTDAYITLYKWGIYYKTKRYWLKPEYQPEDTKYSYFEYNSGVYVHDNVTNTDVHSQITDTIYFGPNTSTTLNGASFSNYYCEFDFNFDVTTAISIQPKDDKNYYRYVTSINYHTVGNTFYAEQVVTIQEGYKTTNTQYYWNVPEEYSRRTLTQQYIGGYTDSYCISINWRSIYNKALSLTPYERSNEEYALSVVSAINAFTSYYSAYQIIIPYDPPTITRKESELGGTFDKDKWLYTYNPGQKKPILRLYKGSDLIYQRT